LEARVLDGCTCRISMGMEFRMSEQVTALGTLRLGMVRLDMVWLDMARQGMLAQFLRQGRVVCVHPERGLQRVAAECHCSTRRPSPHFWPGLAERDTC
jgi:hypothetical protein